MGNFKIDMKTKNTDYKKFFSLEEGGYPEDYPYKNKFHEHVHKMGKLLQYIKDPALPETEFLDSLEQYYKDGFITFYKHCWKEYRKILKKRMKDTSWRNGGWD